MITVVHKWLDAIKKKDFEMAANLWIHTPKVLGIALARKFAGESDLEVEYLCDQNKAGKIYKVHASNGSFLIDVGVLERETELGLVSPQTVLRKHMTQSWYNRRIGKVKLVVERKTLLTESVRYRVTRALETINSFLTVEIKPFTYYVPTPKTHKIFPSMDNKVYGKYANRRWSWLDPYGGDLVSQDPSDAHELAHGCANSLDGWPPVFILEGFAECFTTPYDWKQWKNLERFSLLSDVWSAQPGAVPGWYTSAGVFVVMAYRHFGEDRFVDFWNNIDKKATFLEVAKMMGMSPAILEKQYEEWCIKSIRQGGTAISSGLLCRLLSK